MKTIKTNSTKKKHQSVLTCFPKSPHKRVTCIIAVFVGSALLMSNTNLSGGAASPRTGSPGDGSNCSACHSGSQPLVLDSIIHSDIPDEGYTPGAVYTITASVSRTGHNCFGFEISPQNPTGSLQGNLINTSNETKLVLNNKYVTHTASGTYGNNNKTWSFNWQAPPAGTGTVKFYGAFLAGNNDGGINGDTTILSSLSICEKQTAEVNTLNNQNMEIQLYGNPVYDKIRLGLRLPIAGAVSIYLYNIQGQVVQSLFTGNMQAGQHTLVLDRSIAPDAGIYFLRTECGKQVLVKRLMLSTL